MPTQDANFLRKLDEFAAHPSTAVAASLAAAKDDRALPALVKAMVDHMESDRGAAYREAVRALATPVVLAKWMAGDVDARRVAAQALSARFADHVPLLALGLKDADEQVRAVCRRALRSWAASPALKDLFVESLRHADARVRLLAAEGLGKLGKRADVAALTTALEAETDDRARDRLAWAIERLDDDEAPSDGG